MTQICLFNVRFVSTLYTLKYVIHGPHLGMVLPTDIYRNISSLQVNDL
jgi:hypothetical protein